MQVIEKCHHTSFDWEVDADPEIGITELWIRTINEKGVFGPADSDYSPSDIYYAGHNDVQKVMQERFWWLMYTYNDDIEVHGDGSETHSLGVLMRREVAGYLQVERWLDDGPPVSEPIEPQYPEPTPEESFRLALEADRESEPPEPSDFEPVFKLVAVRTDDQSHPRTEQQRKLDADGTEENDS